MSYYFNSTLIIIDIFKLILKILVKLCTILDAGGLET